jgi:hypothetical protein
MHVRSVITDSLWLVDAHAASFTPHHQTLPPLDMILMPVASECLSLINEREKGQVLPSTQV